MESMVEEFSEFKNAIEFFHSERFFVKHYQLSEEGVPVTEAGITDGVDDEAPEEEPGEVDDESMLTAEESASTFESKPKVRELAARLMANTMSLSLYKKRARRPTISRSSMV